MIKSCELRDDAKRCLLISVSFAFGELRNSALVGRSITAFHLMSTPFIIL